MARTHIDIWIRPSYILVECYYIGGNHIMTLKDWSEVLVNTSFDMAKYQTITVRYGKV